MKRKLILALACLASSMPAFAQSYHVKGGKKCLSSAGIGVLYYYYCDVESVHEASGCEDAWAQLKPQDCCQPNGVVEYNYFNKYYCKAM